MLSDTAPAASRSRHVLLARRQSLFLQPKFKEKLSKIAVEREVLQGLPEVIESDPTRLVQILSNLLSNAIKARMERLRGRPFLPAG